MTEKLIRLSRRYEAALHEHLRKGPRASLEPARALGRQAAACGFETLDVAKIHEQALASLKSSSSTDGIMKRAKSFFFEAITLIEKTHRAALNDNLRFNHLNKALRRRAVDLATLNRQLKQEVVQRQSAERALKKSTAHYARLLKESRRLQKYLRQAAHRILSVHEEVRKKISRRLHDEIAQTLLGINVRLLSLKQEATINAGSLKKELANTQGLVRRSVKTMNQFAREFDKHHEA